jgi:uncharacterized membrane protein
VRGVRSSVSDTVRTKLWPLPVLGVVVAVAAGVGLPLVDTTYGPRLPPVVSQLLFGGDANAARTVLGAVAGSLITVTSLTFSLTVVTLQLASSQFSPRLLRTFTSDLFVQMTLALFLTTFTFAVTVLRTVRGAPAEFVPRFSVTVSYVLAVLSVLGLVLFLAHLATLIRVETMLHNVHADATATVAAVLTTRRDHKDRIGPPAPPPDASVVLAGSSGFVTSLDEADLLAAAQAAGAVVLLQVSPGDFVVTGTPVGEAWPEEGPLTEGTFTELRSAVSAAVRVGPERTAAQDVGFGLRQLTDVTNKALSPGINDPTTAVHALGHISALLCDLADHDLGPTLLSDDTDDTGTGAGRRVRVILMRPDFAELVELAIAQPRRYGASDPQLLGRLFALLAEVGWRAHPEQQSVVVDQLARLRRTVQDQSFDATELAMLHHAGRQVEQALHHQGSLDRHRNGGTRDRR